jgi:hypothetical protein
MDDNELKLEQTKLQYDVDEKRRERTYRYWVTHSKGLA